MKTKTAQEIAETLTDFIAHKDVGELVHQADDSPVRAAYAVLLAKLVELRDRRPSR